MEAELDKKSWSLVKILAIFRCQRNDIFSGTQVNSSKKIEVISLSSFLILGGGVTSFITSSMSYGYLQILADISTYRYSAKAFNRGQK